jgi:alginate O-acetyltransferase complex protein AlgI
MSLDSASFQFVLFGLVAALVSNLSRSPRWRSAVLALASLAFLALLAPNAYVLLPLAGFLLLGYICLLLLQRGWSRSLAWSIVVIVLAYVWLKKYTFLPHAIFLDRPYFVLGLSYIFFRVLHLIIETAEEPKKWRIGPGTYLLYLFNFTTFLSGPIQRYDEFAQDQFVQDQFAGEPIPLGARVVGAQLERIVRGFFKVNVLAMLLHEAQGSALAQIFAPLPVEPRMVAAGRLAILFPLFLYCDFSGYIDIVIALARLMRVRLPENFDRPFSASSFLDFWNRWHITLSTWLKTYVYNPLLLALMRRSESITLQPFLGVLCFFVTFFLVGVWHGRTSEFLVFGVLLGAGVSINKLWQLWLVHAMGRKRYNALARNSVYAALGRGLTFSWFALANFLFWADWKQIDRLIHAIGARNWLLVWLAVWFATAAALSLWEWLRGMLLSWRTSEGPVLAGRYARVVYASAMGLVALVVTVLLSQPAPEIVYKVF